MSKAPGGRSCVHSLAHRRVTHAARSRSGASKHLNIHAFDGSDLCGHHTEIRQVEHMQDGL